jgi:ureidoglycolate lyase
MTRFTLTPKPLTSDAFAPFGEIVQCAGNTPFMINDGNTERYDSLVKVELENPSEDTAVINIFRAQPRTLPLQIRMMERHPFGSQSFHPLSGEDYLVLVADAVEDLQPENLHLFLASKNQGVNYRKNTWHHPILALNKVCDFLIVDRKGAGHNCEEFFFSDDAEIRISL